MTASTRRDISTSLRYWRARALGAHHSFDILRFRSSVGCSISPEVLKSCPNPLHISGPKSISPHFFLIDCESKNNESFFGISIAS